jgi:hypothetical protein
VTREILEHRSRYRILIPLTNSTKTNSESISIFSLSSEDRRRDRYRSHNLLANIYACLLVFKNFAEQNKETFLWSDPSRKHLAATSIGYNIKLNIILHE